PRRALVPSSIRELSIHRVHRDDPRGRCHSSVMSGAQGPCTVRRRIVGNCTHSAPFGRWASSANVSYLNQRKHLSVGFGDVGGDIVHWDPFAGASFVEAV